MNDLTASPHVRPEIFPSSEEIERYWEFVASELKPFATTLPKTLWHYTSGEGLIGIVQSGSLFSTHISCLNDSAELNYASNLLLQSLKMRASQHYPQSPKSVLHTVIDTPSKVSSSIISPFFVACFTENGDDLSQWRGYGGGEGGYAIGFEPSWLLQGFLHDPKVIYKMSYDHEQHRHLADRVALHTETYFQNGLDIRPGVSPRDWAEAFLPIWVNAITQLGPVVKHPSFYGENEWRFVHRLRSEDRSQLVFRQRRSMMARHFPLRFPPPDQRECNILPINHIRVGPSRHKEVSLISVQDLLLSSGYEDRVTVDMSPIPFQSL
ncbi:DUF2971 domain-containing protein [Roseomonas sp. OT10]|uniref:DUF2971 domain-containing protein n=1 Tax=Roseomonas cutis TaxID=2897332 RepID=UPI001E5A9CA2|nr:DUF2971 domain-containing protein [Roseomonas sp. OT10]UFN49134.1 DUF2971 domain-containing protein [Roseomonas sp. OT10]